MRLCDFVHEPAHERPQSELLQIGLREDVLLLRTPVEPSGIEYEERACGGESGANHRFADGGAQLRNTGLHVKSAVEGADSGGVHPPRGAQTPRRRAQLPSDIVDDLLLERGLIGDACPEDGREFLPGLQWIDHRSAGAVAQQVQSVEDVR